LITSKQHVQITFNSVCLATKRAVKDLGEYGVVGVFDFDDLLS